MSIPAINFCIEQKDLPPGEWVVLFHLCHCHNHETGRCDPSQEYLADMTNMGLRTVQRHLSALEKKGKIARRKRGVEGGGRLSDRYAIGHEPAKMAEYVTRHLMHTNPPSHAEKVHEMAGKQEEQDIVPRPEKPPPKKSRAVALPNDWVPSDENISYALSKNFTEKDIQDEADQFRDYHLSRGTTFKDWDAGWRTWCRNAVKFRGRGVDGSPQPGRYGQGSSIASIVARRHAGG